MKTFLIIFCVIFCEFTVADEVYKWTDENGKVHFGDSKAAPIISEKLSIKDDPPHYPTNFKGSATRTKPLSLPISRSTPFSTTPRMPIFNSNKKSVPVNYARVNPKCKDIVDQIEKVKPGTPWEELASKYHQFCADIAYECIVYKRIPKNNKCMWIERTGDEPIIQKKTYE